MPAIKVYTSNLGFYQVAVAARSQRMALAHWGMKRDLFREGLAEESRDPKAVEAAMRKVGMVVRRPLGSTGPFEERAEAQQTLVKRLGSSRAKSKPPPKQSAVKSKSLAKAKPAEVRSVSSRKASRASAKRKVNPKRKPLPREKGDDPSIRYPLPREAGGEGRVRGLSSEGAETEARTRCRDIHFRKVLPWRLTLPPFNYAQALQAERYADRTGSGRRASER
ncbi:MAG TPA: hypothetical protein VIM02_13275 [Rhizomicrobium sp.]|jgi:hypothetical protein